MKTAIFAFLSIFFTFLFISCKTNDKTEDNQGITINVTRAKANDRIPKKEYSFIARPFRASELSFRVGGPIDRFEVYAGNYYKCGDIIAEIDARDFHIRKERTEAIYKQAKAEYERIKVLYEKNNVSASTCEKAEADYTSAKTAFETATNELNDTKLIAPFNGYVGEVYIEKYQDVKATQPIISFIDLNQLKIEAYVTQDVAFQARELEKAELRFDAIPQHTYEARITEISKGTTSNNLSYLLTALFPNKDGQFLAGMSGKLTLDLQDRERPGHRVVLPQIAVCHRPAEGDYVWVVDARNQKVNKRRIVSGELLPNGYITVCQGLQADEIVAVSGLRFLSEDTPVRIAM